jgi:hypothetical protein
MKLFYILFFISSIGFSQEIEIPESIVLTYNEEGVKIIKNGVNGLYYVALRVK